MLVRVVQASEIRAHRWLSLRPSDWTGRSPKTIHEDIARCQISIQRKQSELKRLRQELEAATAMAAKHQKAINSGT